MISALIVVGLMRHERLDCGLRTCRPSAYSLTPKKSQNARLTFLALADLL